MHVEGQIGKRDLGFGACDADGADKQADLFAFKCANTCSTGRSLWIWGVTAPDIRWHRPLLGLPAANAADPTMGFQRAFVALAAVGRIRPDIRGSVVLAHHVAQHAHIVACTISDLALADDSDMKCAVLGSFASGVVKTVAKLGILLRSVRALLNRPSV